jgi:4-hydroxy-3-polyprenylbenzoate decarboxylase
LHFLTNTTIDTLDYSGNDWNSGSKIIMSVNRDPLRKLTIRFGIDISKSRTRLILIPNFLLEGISIDTISQNGSSYNSAEDEMQLLNDKLKSINLNGLAMIVICDDIEFTSCSWNNFLWITFTRTNPSHDIYGINSYTMHKHWACKGPLVFDARIKTHHAPPLLVSEETNKSVDKFIASSPSLQSILQ